MQPSVLTSYSFQRESKNITTGIQHNCEEKASNKQLNALFESGRLGVWVVFVSSHFHVIAHNTVLKVDIQLPCVRAIRISGINAWRVRLQVVISDIRIDKIRVIINVVCGIRVAHIIAVRNATVCCGAAVQIVGVVPENAVDCFSFDSRPEVNSGDRVADNAVIPDQSGGMCINQLYSVTVIIYPVILDGRRQRDRRIYAGA